ncbi:MAG: glycosyltransferase [Porticoccaceae bacterium]|nr:glycosyltransferase [Porticoccaceae bacterium]
MKILYGVQGTGNGHITRARAMARELQACGVSVDYLFSGREADKFFDMTVFGDYRLRKGLTFASKEGRIRPLATLVNSQPLQFWRDVKTLDLTPYDLVVTDFEPVTAWAGKYRKVRVVGLGHQYAFHHNIPQHHGSLVQQGVLKYFAPASVSVGLHWHHFGQPILPPIAPVAASGEAVIRKHYVVYLPFESVAAIGKLLRQFPAYNFHVYHPEVDASREGHIHWFSPGRESFQADLHRCEGVICNAGFELASEVLQLGRKLLVKPVRGQSEQYSNALALDLLGYGHVMYDLNAAKVASWLDGAGATRVDYPNVARAICHWLLAGADGDVGTLAQTLWSATHLPDITAVTRTENSLVNSVALER